MSSQTDTGEWRDILQEKPFDAPLGSFNKIMQGRQDCVDVAVGPETYSDVEIQQEIGSDLHVMITERPDSFKAYSIHPALKAAKTDGKARINTPQNNIVVEFDQEGYNGSFSLNLPYSNLNVSLPTRESFWEKKIERGISGIAENSQLYDNSHDSSTYSSLEEYLSDTEMEASTISQYMDNVEEQISMGIAIKPAVAAAYKSSEGGDFEQLADRFDASHEAVKQSYEEMVSGDDGDSPKDEVSGQGRERDGYR